MSITLCNNLNCAIRRQCYRGTANRHALATVQRFASYQVPGTNIVKCDSFLPLRRSA